MNHTLTDQNDLRKQFDQWARTYDQELDNVSETFPFAGYALTLATVWERARVMPGMSIMDLGVGTGNLARLFLESGCQVLGVDFSSEMLARARQKLPQLDLVQADLTSSEWPGALNRRFDRIVSNYLFHEFQLETKIVILSRLAKDHLAVGGRIVIGDIAFPTATDLQKNREELGDSWEEEFYWTTVETHELLDSTGWIVEAIQTSFCAAVYVLTPPNNQSHGESA